MRSATSSSAVAARLAEVPSTSVSLAEVLATRPQIDHVHEDGIRRTRRSSTFVVETNDDGAEKIERSARVEEGHFRTSKKVAGRTEVQQTK